MYPTVLTIFLLTVLASTASAVSGSCHLAILSSPTQQTDATSSAATDTIPALTRAERREFRMLERERRRALRRDGQAAPPELSGAPKGRNGFAIAALAAGVAGVLMVLPVLFVADAGIFLFFTAAFVCALIFGAIGKKRAKRKNRKHRGIAIAGFVLGIIGAAYSALLLFALATSTAG